MLNIEVFKKFHLLPDSVHMWHYKSLSNSSLLLWHTTSQYGTPLYSPTIPIHYVHNFIIINSLEYIYVLHDQTTLCVFQATSQVSNISVHIPKWALAYNIYVYRGWQIKTYCILRLDIDVGAWLL